MNQDFKTIADLRRRVLAGENLSNADLIAGLTALRAARRAKPPFLWKLKTWKRRFFYWLRYGRQDAAELDAQFALADQQECMCDDY